MKRGLIILILLLLLVPLAFAQPDTTTTGETDDELPDVELPDKEELQENLEKEHTVPKNLRWLTRNIIGIPEESVTISGLIVALVFWLIVFIITTNVVGLLKYFRYQIINYIISFAIVVVLSSTKAISIMIDFFFWLGKLFGLFADTPLIEAIISPIISIALMIAAALALINLLILIKRYKEILRARWRGKRIRKYIES